MAMSVVGFFTGAYQNNSGAAFNLPAKSVTTGNSILVAVTGSYGSPPAVSDNLGNTYTKVAENSNPTGAYQYIYVARNITGGSCTITVDPFTGYTTAQAIEFSNLPYAVFVDVVKYQAGFGPVHNINSTSLANTSEILFGFGSTGSDDATTFTDQSTLFSNMQVIRNGTASDPNNLVSVLGYYVVTGPGSVSVVWQRDGSDSSYGGATMLSVSDQPLYTVVTKTQTGKANIRAVQTKNQTGKGNIRNNVTRNQVGVAKVVYTQQKTQTGKARLTRTMLKTQLGKASVLNAVQQSIPGKANVRTAAPAIQFGNARIQRVMPRTITGVARMQIPSVRAQTGKARMANKMSRPQFGTGRIAQKPLFPGKKFVYKIYSKTGAYIASLTDVPSDFSYSQEINSAGSQFVLSLPKQADDFGEGTLVTWGNEVKVYVYDQDTPSGKLLFDGYMSNYTPVYSPEGEHVDVTVLGYGATLDNFLIETGESTQITNASGSQFRGLGNSVGGRAVMAQSITSPAAEKVSAVELRVKCATGYAPRNLTMKIFAGNPSGQPMPVTSPLATVTKVIADDVETTYKFTFPSALSFANGAMWYWTLETDFWTGSGEPSPIQILSDTANPYAGGASYSIDTGGGPNFAAIATDDMWFKVYKTTGSTTAAYNSVDPSTILKSILDDYIAKGGKVSYDNTTIDMTGTTVSYTFNTNTTLEGVKKCLELAPQGWYFYIDQATNMVHFHQKVETPDYLFLIDKHIESISIKKSIENVVNAVVFTGGETGSGILFKRYVRQSSIDLYGYRVLRITDQRVTQEATALTMANTVLDTRSAPELSTTITIIDNAINPKIGYDLENILLGKMIALGGQGFGGQGTSLWDKMVWEVDYWDFDLANLSTLVLQITKLAYTGDKVTLNLSTVPPDVNKRMEDINRNLQATQTAYNPDTPA